MRALVVGCGSAGRRHISNLLKLGVEVYAYDRDLPLLERTLKEYNIKTYDFKSRHISLDAFVVCTIPPYHVPFAFESLSHNAHCFIEKPISHNLDRLDELITSYEKAKLTLMVGYQFRFNAGLQEIKRIIETNELGRLLSIRAEYGNHLKNWHKGEDYHKLYTGHKNEGGGIILDSSHELDYCMWLVGVPVVEVKSMIGKVSDLDIDVEDTADILLKFNNNVVANIHLDMVDKEYKRNCTLVFDKGTIYWTPYLMVSMSGQEHKYMQEIDEYLLEMQAFIDCIRGKSKPAVDGKCAAETLKICLKTLNNT